MCGIAGIVGNNLPPDASAAIASMVASLALRGPDGEGIATWPEALLGHRRLAIFDLSEAGRQPMLSSAGDIGVVFNGAIYNFLDIREELRAKGHQFHSECDTEILVEGYLEWGIDELVKRLRGMFAFAIWDNRTSVLYMVRDRLGVKPLVYTERNGFVAFASTVRALDEAGLADGLDRDAVLEFLEFGFVTDDRAIFQGVHKVPAGVIVEWRNGHTSQRVYWSLPRAENDAKVSFNSAVEETEAGLIEAVKLRLSADVPLGALLSGGIDSTLVCWAMGQLNADIRAFTVSTPGDRGDESGAASETARRLGIAHEVVELPANVPPSLDELIEAYSEPFACASSLGMLRVSKAIRSKLTVLLTGDGGDDVFLGYPYHRHLWMAQRTARMLPPGADVAWRSVRPLAASRFLKRPKHFLDYATGGVGAVTRVHDGLPYYWRLDLLGERLAGGTISRREMPLSGSAGKNVLQDFLDYDQGTRFVSEFMTKVDGATMRYAIEARSPFLDQKLWELAARLPFGTRLHNGELKAILREIVRRRVGPDVASRPKQGFTIPVESWLVQQWRSELEHLRSGSVLEEDGWIQRGSLERAINEALARGKAPTQLWYLMVLEKWLERRKSAAGDQRFRFAEQSVA